jgi:hypothetical protein
VPSTPVGVFCNLFDLDDRRVVGGWDALREVWPDASYAYVGHDGQSVTFWRRADGSTVVIPMTAALRHFCEVHA